MDLAREISMERGGRPASVEMFLSISCSGGVTI